MSLLYCTGITDVDEDAAEGEVTGVSSIIASISRLMAAKSSSSSLDAPFPSVDAAKYDRLHIALRDAWRVIVVKGEKPQQISLS